MNPIEHPPLENDRPEIKWPRSFKGSLVFGVGMIAASGTVLGLEAIGIVHDLGILGNTAFGVMIPAGGWRIAEPFLMMRELRGHPTNLFKPKSD